MGYACPVCEVPQQDAEHLANHLAFTALLHEADHADWLDESVPDWREDGPEDLAPKVAEVAEEADYDAVFEDTTGHDHQHAGHQQSEHGHQHAEHGQSAHDLGVDPAAAGRQAASEELDAEARSVLQEARAMTREMLDDADAEGTTDTDAERDDEATTDADDTDTGNSADVTDADDADGNS
jgi:hypothetical protein